MSNGAKSGDRLAAAMGGRHDPDDAVRVLGSYSAVCRDAAGGVLWAQDFPNALVTVGRNFLLDAALQSTAYTSAAWMGLISSTSWTTVAAADTMGTHGGWLEAGIANAPTYSGGRIPCVWSAASAGVKQLSAGLVFTFTGTGTVQGAFIVGGASANNTVGGVVGILYSAGALTTPQPVISTNTLTLSYSTTLT